MTPKSHVIPISVQGDAILTLRNPTDKRLRGIQDYEVKYRVCFLTLRGVSPYFQAIFKHSFAEATPQNDGMLHLCVEGFHSRAMIILLKFLHGHKVITRRALSHEDLVNIAIIVDYYAISIASLARYSQYGATYFQEAVVRLIGGRVDSWDFYVTIPKGQHKKDVELLFVTWMFGVSWLFERLVSDLMEDLTAPLEDFDLPISSVVLSINQYNQQFVHCDVVNLDNS